MSRIFQKSCEPRALPVADPVEEQMLCCSVSGHMELQLVRAVPRYETVSISFSSVRLDNSPAIERWLGKGDYTSSGFCQLSQLRGTSHQPTWNIIVMAEQLMQGSGLG